MPLVRACSRPGCPDHAPLDARFCPEHAYVEEALRRQREINRAARPQRRLAKQVYDDPRWKQCRAAVLERDGQRCVMCAAEHGLNAHHILGLTYTDDDFDPELAITLCSDCHPIAERRRKQGYARR